MYINYQTQLTGGPTPQQQMQEYAEQQRWATQSRTDKLAAETTAAANRANAATKAREEEMRAILDEVIGMYRQGGSYGGGVEAGLERERTKTMAAGTQSLVSSGLYNTTQAAGLAGKFSEEVAMPTRMKLEDLRMDRLSSALGQKASMIGDITQTQPDYKLLASLLQQ